MIKNIIVDGIDRLGKSSLIQGLQDKLGYFQVLHFGKPQLLDYYNSSNSNNANDSVNIPIKYKKYQVACFDNMLHMLSSNAKFIFDRSHIGEFVYAPRYRGYDGSYIFDLETKFINDLGSKFDTNTLLIMLRTTDFSFVKDDGQSLDFNKKEEEQIDFIRAFEKSNIKNKVLIDVNDGTGNYVSKEIILNAVLQCIDSIKSSPKTVWHISWLYDSDGIINQKTSIFDDPKRLFS